MTLGSLRNTAVYDTLKQQLRKHSLPISGLPQLGSGGTGTLVKYNGISGILTATHVIADFLDTREIFAPFIATEDPTFFINGRIPIKKFHYLDTEQGLQKLRENARYSEDFFDICMIELDEDVVDNILKQSKKQIVDLSVYKSKYENNFDYYCCSDNDWCWAVDGAPREDAVQDNDNILHSRYDGLYVSGGAYRTNFPTYVPAKYSMSADLGVHQLGPTLDSLPCSFRGISGAGVWQVAFEGNDGRPTAIQELFFSGIIVCEVTQEKLISRGPSSLYDIFLSYLESIS